MYNTIKNKQTLLLRKNILIITFMFLLFPFLMHIYGALFDLFSFGYFYIYLFLIFIIIIILGIKKTKLIFTKEICVFLLFLCFIYIDSLFFNQNNIGSAIKYTLYVFFYFIILKKYFNKKIYYKLFINIISVIILFEIILYVIFFLFHNNDVIYAFSRDNLSFMFEKSPFYIRTDWDYSLPFYMIVFPENLPDKGILGLPRFFGFSPEPTLLACVLLPSLFIAYKEKQYISFFIILFAFLLASSYGSIIILFIALIYYFFYKYRKLITFILILFIIIIFEFLSSYSFDSPRLQLYSKIFLNILKIDSLSLFSTSSFLNIEVPSAALEFYLKFGFLPFLSYLMLLWYFLKKSMQIDRFIFTFTIASILMLNKSGEILSPLLLFYFNYISTYRMKYEKITISS